jgi:hypothetical protein
VPPCATCAIWYNLCRASRWAAPLTACQCLKNNQRKSNAIIVKYLNAAIEDALDSGLPRAYTPELYRRKYSALFEHVYESYPERDAGFYPMAV